MPLSCTCVQSLNRFKHQLCDFEPVQTTFSTGSTRILFGVLPTRGHISPWEKASVRQSQKITATAREMSLTSRQVVNLSETNTASANPLSEFGLIGRSCFSHDNLDSANAVRTNFKDSISAILVSRAMVLLSSYGILI